MAESPGISHRRRSRGGGWPLRLLLMLLAVSWWGGSQIGGDRRPVPPARVSAQTDDCAVATVAIGQLPPAGALFSTGTFHADYSAPTRGGGELVPSTALGLRISRHRLWLHDLTIEVSLFPSDTTAGDPRNGCLGRAVLEINIPEERLFLDGQTITLTTTELSLTEASAFYAEGGDPGFTATAVHGTLSLQSVNGGRVRATFTLTFNPEADPRTFVNGVLEDDVDQNPAATGRQP
jgi:hypothetical protein